MVPGDWVTVPSASPVQFAWSSIRSATEYEIRLITLSSPQGRIDARFRTTEPRFSIVLYPNCTWYWTLRAKNASGWSPASRDKAFYTWDGVSPHPSRPWTGGPSNPGTVHPPLPRQNLPPVVQGPTGPAEVTGLLGVSATYTATVADDGLPVPPGRTTVTWRRTLLSVPGIGGIQQPILRPSPVVVAGSQSSARISFPQSGRYRIEVTASDGALSTTRSIEVVARLRSGPWVPIP